MSPPRLALVCRGSPETTAAAARTLIEDIPRQDVLWISDADAPADLVATSASSTKAQLGRSFDAVVLDCHPGLDPDVLGRAQGFVWGGGALVLRLPPEGELPEDDRARLAAFPFREEDVTSRFWSRFLRCLDDGRQPGALGGAPAVRDATPGERLPPAPHATSGTDEQARVVDTLAARLAAPTPSVTVLVADRGRGKSSALGLALANARRAGSLKVAVTAGSEASAAEVFRFAGEVVDDDIRFVSPVSLAYEAELFDVIVVDEAAQVPVPLLQEIVLSHPHARIAFASTTHGYEGTGRGFSLRFVEWLRGQTRAVKELSLETPIRWGKDDPLEAFVFTALVLDAEPPSEVELGLGAGFDPSAIVHTTLDRDRLAVDERALRDFFGLLVHAHYRTTPSDLHRMLDAPNLALHALLYRDRVVAATMVAKEGGLPPDLCRDLARGRARIRGHALPDTLVCHSGRTDAGELDMIRSVRIATHPALRRRGLATRLIDAIHQSYAPDLFGTVFGATAELLSFRRTVGYHLVRLGTSRGSRTGEPAAVMLRPVSARARALCDDLRRTLARDLPLQLELLSIEGELRIEPRLAAALSDDLPAPAPLDDDDARALTLSYAWGSRPYESAASGVMRYVERHRSALDDIEPTAKALIELRVRQKRAWLELTPKLGFPTVHAAMRALRRAVRELVLRSEPDLDPETLP